MKEGCWDEVNVEEELLILLTQDDQIFDVFCEWTNHRTWPAYQPSSFSFPFHSLLREEINLYVCWMLSNNNEWFLFERLPHHSLALKHFSSSSSSTSTNSLIKVIREVREWTVEIIATLNCSGSFKWQNYQTGTWRQTQLLSKRKKMP